MRDESMTTVNVAAFEELKAAFPPGHTENSSSYPISHTVYALVRLIQPSHVVEVGTFSGATSAWIARAIAENQRGKFTGYEVQPELATATRDTLRKAVPGGAWDIKTMNVLEETYIETDFLFLDCDKTLYPAALSKCLIPINGYVVAHDTVSWPAAAHFYRYVKTFDEYEVVNLHTEQGLMIARKVR